MTGTARFDCYPSDFLNGVIGLQADQIAVYTVVLMLQYDRGVPVQYKGREKEIAVRSGLSIGRLAKAIEGLIEVEKLSLNDSGALFNARASKELKKISEKLRENAENSIRGGIATKEKWERIRNENNDRDRPSGQPDGKPKQGPIPSPSPSPEEKEPFGFQKELLDPKPRPVRASTIPPDLALDENFVEAASKVGLPPARHRSEFGKFFDHHKAKGSLMKDWLAAWRTWCRNSVDNFGRGPGPPAFQQSHAKRPESRVQWSIE